MTSTNATPPPHQNLRDVLGVGFFDSEKMTFPEISDMYFDKLTVFDQYLVSDPRPPLKGR